MATDLLSIVRTRLLMNSPFFGTQSYMLRTQIDNTIQTLQTDGTSLWYNADYLGSLSSLEQQFVLAHEVLHCVLLHPYRRGTRDPLEWNIACDYAVNALLKKAGFIMPGIMPGLYDRQFEGMSAEQIYSLRQNQKPPEPEPEPQPQPQPQQASGDGEGNPDDDGEGGPDNDGEGDPNNDGEGNPDEDGDGIGTSGAGQGTPGQGKPAPKQIMPNSPTGEFTDAPKPEQQVEGGMSEQDWQISAEQAARVASAAGNMPGGIESEMKNTREPRVDWVTQTRDFVTNTLPSDYSWTKPNRRFIGAGVYLPGTTKQNVGRIVLGIDSSGSTWSILDIFRSEILGIIREARPEAVDVVYWDTKVQGHEEFTPDSAEIEIKIRGGGGTLAQPMFDWVEKLPEPPVALIMFTDLDLGDKPKEPDYPVLWCVPEYVRQPAPFGQLVHIQEQK